VAVFIDKKT